MKKNKIFKFLIVFWCFYFPFFTEAFESLETASKKTALRIPASSLSDLQALTPYESVAVIQKRYLPKTFRGEWNLSILSILNNRYVYSGGLATKIGFFLKEAHGFGAEVFGVYPISKPVKNNLNQQGIFPYSSTYFQYYLGGYYKWSPVFGKFSILNKKIIYFDTYFTLGAGLSRSISGSKFEVKDQLEVFQEQLKVSQDRGKIQKKILNLKAFSEEIVLKSPWAPSMTINFGQIFSLSQSLAFQWELKWLFRYIQYDKGSSNSFDVPDMIFFIGLNYYYPEASYR